jgi:hypothetical protein
MFLVVGPISVVVKRLEDGRLEISLPTHIDLRVVRKSPESGQVTAPEARGKRLLTNLYRMAANPVLN